MSETRKVHMAGHHEAHSNRLQSRCGRYRSAHPVILSGDFMLHAHWTDALSRFDRPHFASRAVFVDLPRVAQCEMCRRWHAPHSASPAHILSVSLFLGGLAGWLPAAARDLVADVCAGAVDLVPVLLDLAEDHASGWERCEVEWPRIERHEHVFFNERIGGVRTGALRCTCGAYTSGDSRCADRACQREHGHRGLHMSRSWDERLGEIVDEWGDVDAANLEAISGHMAGIEADMTRLGLL
jgi:hypothetical protein